MRNVIFDKDVDGCVDHLGGYRVIDDAVAPVLDALSRNPYAFEKIENDFTSVRYARTHPIRDVCPPLFFTFVIDDKKDVVITWVEEDAYYAAAK